MKRTRSLLSHYGSSHGYTMMELLVTLSIVAILGLAALPAFTPLSDSFNRLTARSVILQDIKRAQAQALTEGCRGIMTIDGNGESYSYGCDYLPYDVSDPPAPDLVTFVRNLPARTEISSSSDLIFNSRGLAVDQDDVISNTTITLYDTSSGSPVQFSQGTLLGTGLFAFD